MGYSQSLAGVKLGSDIFYFKSFRYFDFLFCHTDHKVDIFYQKMLTSTLKGVFYYINAM